MADNTLPTVDQAFPSQGGGSNNNVGLPSADQAFPTSSTPSSPSTTPSSYSGPIADLRFSGQLKTAEPNDSSTVLGRIMNAFSQGAKDGWGDRDLGLSPEEDETLRKMNWFNDYKNNKTSFIKSANEAFIRPGAAGLDAAMRGTTAAFSGISGGLAQTATELKQKASQEDPTDQLSILHAVGLPTLRQMTQGVLGEVLGDISSGALPEGGVPHIGESTLSSARAKGVIGEGEKGFFNTEKPTPENLEARQAAAEEAGQPNIPVEQKPLPPTKDVNILARQVSPDVFKEYDAKVTYHEELSKRLEDLQPPADHAEVPGIIEKSPELKQTEEAFKENLNRLQELEPQVVDAYRHASGLLLDSTPTEDLTTPAVSTPQAVYPEEGPSAGQPQDASVRAPESLQEGNSNRLTPDAKPLTAVSGPGEEKPFGLAQSILDKAQENGLVPEGEHFDIPGAKSTTWEYQATKAGELVENDYETAKQIAMGQKEAPHGVLPEAVLIGVEERATREGDIGLIRELGTRSALLGEARTMGQRIGILSQRVVDNPIDAVREVQAAREADAIRRKVDRSSVEKQISQEIKDVINKESNKDPRVFSEFIKQIECDY